MKDTVWIGIENLKRTEKVGLIWVVNKHRVKRTHSSFEKGCVVKRTVEDVVEKSFRVGITKENVINVLAVFEDKTLVKIICWSSKVEKRGFQKPTESQGIEILAVTELPTEKG